MKTLIRGAYVVGFDGSRHEIIRNGAVVFENDRIVHVGRDYPGPVDRTLAAPGSLISPGFINSHIHTGSNAGDYMLTEADKPDFLGSNYLAHAGPLKGKSAPHHLENLDVSVRFSLIHCLKGGSTTVLDYGGAERGLQDYVNLVGEVGIRCVTGLRFRDADYCFDAEGRQQYLWNEERGTERFNKAVEFAKRLHAAGNSRVTAMLFPGQVDTCTPETLAKAKRAADEIGIPIQIHTAMNLLEFHEILRRHRCSPLELLQRTGILGPRTSLGHCIFLNHHSWVSYPYGNDLAIIADSGSSVSYSPLKYLMLGVVMESFDRYLAAGINMSLGTDTYPKDMVSEMRCAALASRVADRKFTSGHPRDVFNAATLGGARLLGREDLGRLEKGAKADIIAVDLKDIGFGAVRDPIRSLIEGATRRDIKTVIVDGEVLVQDGTYLRTSEQPLLEKLQSVADEVWSAVPAWHWTGKPVDELIPPSFAMK
jgi:cytosine/adenosine deaminase-related metal-dependent hydrolase